MERIKQILLQWQKAGVPVFFIRDKGVPSVTLTLVVMSATFVMFGLVNGAARIVGGMDMQSALYWHGMCLAAYLGRKFSKSEGLGDSVEKSPDKKKD